MQIKTLCQSQTLSVLDYRCGARPNDKPFAEQFFVHSVSYVHMGSFGCLSRGRFFELVPGSLLIGRTGDEYLCTHDHRCGGDECLSFQLASEFVDSIGGDDKIWRVGRVPPLPELMVLGELAWLATQGRSEISVEEVGLLLLQRFAAIVSDRSQPHSKLDGRQRRRVIETAVWLDENSQQPLSLDILANKAGFSQFHFLRVFTRVLGVTPHQYGLRSRLRRAVHLLADYDRSITEVAFEAGFNDLSNFVRTFHRAAGLPPGQFRLLTRGKKQYFPRLARIADRI